MKGCHYSGPVRSGPVLLLAEPILAHQQSGVGQLYWGVKSSPNAQFEERLDVFNGAEAGAIREPFHALDTKCVELLSRHAGP